MTKLMNSRFGLWLAAATLKQKIVLLICGVLMSGMVGYGGYLIYLNTQADNGAETQAEKEINVTAITDSTQNTNTDATTVTAQTQVVDPATYAPMDSSASVVNNAASTPVTSTVNQDYYVSPENGGRYEAPAEEPSYSEPSSSGESSSQAAVASSGGSSASYDDLYGSYEATKPSDGAPSPGCDNSNGGWSSNATGN